MGKGRGSKNESATGAGEKKEKTTHFLCFPLATETTVPQLAKSLEHFRNVSTEPEKPKRRLEETADGRIKVMTGDAKAESDDERPNGTNEASTTLNEDDPLGNIKHPTSDEHTFADSLKVLPNIVHRAAGTYHFTLGVMDLSEEARMQKAKDFLHSLDLQQILRDSEKGPPASAKQARKWQDEDAKETGEIEDEVSADVEVQKDESAATTSTRGVRSLERPVSPPPTSAAPAGQQDEPTSDAVSPLYVSLTGLGAFPKDKGARVIWARPREQTQAISDSNSEPYVTENTRLYNFSLHLREIFRKEGFINETRPLVLHATVANMRYKMQAKGGRTTKGRKWAHGKKRWQEGTVDARPFLKLFNQFEGNMEEAERASADAATGDGEEDGTEDETGGKASQQKANDRDKPVTSPEKEYIWVRDAMIDRVAICKMGATEATDPVWGYWYPPVSEKMIFGT
ncbi:hypothetical protein LTR70_009214 [Exophiala xenobiotica]|uniref:A-kinase anchor protein 7-like phosphoesterase domain-containing protein n=1 Tax=Lithohypha guttulata TaxID=1690604 RepID=A0ABR0JTH5_9EURO|nr:hypothetical protein LTR24_010643 [Lithohypha guttulata]KAK5310824.1 hypothetical protein LTR70_009214 [Exophiala xenobiotica]